jgi:hypothetical protein
MVMNVGAVPVVPPHVGVTVNGADIMGSSTYGVDGVRCNGCRIHDATIEYGGGVYDFQSTTVELPVRIVLKGAALNTAQFLQTFGLLGCPAKATPHVNPDAPRIMTASSKPDKHFSSAVGPE